jgi:hypothetical protein
MLCRDRQCYCFTFICLLMAIARSWAILAMAPEPILPGKTATAHPSPSLNDPLYRFLGDSRERQNGFEILINLPSFQLFLYQNGQLLHRYPIAIGKEVSPSVLVTTLITNKVENPTYYPPDWAKKGLKPIPPGPRNPVGSRWLGLAQKGYGIHGTNNPSSIGSAASAGCIRMHNQDVEHLAKIVPVGTPVTFVYQPLLIWYDPVAQWPMVHVFPDIYRHGGIDTNCALERLQQLGVDEPIHMEALAWMLSHPMSEPMPVPILTEVDVVDHGSIPAYKTHSDTFISLQALAGLLGGKSTLDDREGDTGRVAGRTEGYAPLESAAAAFGLMVDTELGRLVPVTLMRNGASLAVSTYLAAETLLVSVEALASIVGVPVSWDASLRAPRVSGTPISDCRILADRAYAPYATLAAALGVRIEWQLGRTTAELRRPQVSLGTHSSPGLWYEDEVWLPVRLVAEGLGLTPIWDRVESQVYLGQNMIPGCLQGGRVYAAQARVLALFPEITTLWDDLSATLELHTQGAPLDVGPGRLRDARESPSDSS